MSKIGAALDALDAGCGDWGDRFDIGTLTVACALGYLDYRFPELGWETGRTTLAAWFGDVLDRPSMQATRPRG